MKNKYGLEIENLANSNHSPEYFLSAIKNSKYFVTDSFHGTCFALIFNKKIICLLNKRRGESRFKNLAEKFNVDFIFFENYEEIKNCKNLFQNIDYENFLIKTENEKEKAKLWLKNAFEIKEKYSFTKFLREKYFQFLLICFKKNPFKKLLKKLKQYKLFKKFNAALKENSSSKIVFWGASLFLKEFIEKYKIKDDNILAIVDKNPSKKFFGKYEILPIEKLENLNPDIVICSIKNNHKAIYQKIKGYLKENYPKTKLEKDLFSMNFRF